PAILSPIVFVGLVATLWTYKCLMMIIFQNKIIYMPGVPLGARRERIEDYAVVCSGIRWKEVQIPTKDGHLLRGAVAEELGHIVAAGAGKQAGKPYKRRVIIVYYQGNASSTPPRLPMLSSLLLELSRTPHSLEPQVKEVLYTVVVPAYRGYWTSTGKPSQRGIEEDGRAIFRFLEKGGYKVHPGNNEDPIELDERVELIIWGQSIGANIAMTTLANHMSQCVQPAEKLPSPAAIILETPLLSIPEMLIELYPQKWLPYRYLSPFLRNWWDMQDAAKKLHIAGYSPGKISILVAEKDELVGVAQGEKIDSLLQDYFAVEGETGQREVKKTVVKGALHVECLLKNQGRREVMDTIQAVGEK
ncbi:alpha/beta superfamily hydrolase, partial [Tirmania nivea]